MSVEGQGDLTWEEKGDEYFLDSASSEQVQDSTWAESFYPNEVLDLHSSVDIQNDSTSPRPLFTPFLSPSILESLIKSEGNVSWAGISTTMLKELSKQEQKSPRSGSLGHSDTNAQSQPDNIPRQLLTDTNWQGLHPIKNMPRVSEAQLLTGLQSPPTPTQQLARGLVGSATSKRCLDEVLQKEHSDEKSDSPVLDSSTLLGSQESTVLTLAHLTSDSGENSIENSVVFCRGVTVNVPGSPLCRPKRKTPYQLPSLDEKAQILFFQEQFRNPSSVIFTGNWEIPVHGSIILVKSPLLAEMLSSSSRNEDCMTTELDEKPHCVRKHRRRRSRILKIGNQLKEIPLNYLHIEKPPLAVFEFLKIFYPQCQLDLHALSKWSEVIAILTLCVEYDVAGSELVIKNCCEYMRTILKDQSLDDLLSVKTRSGFFVESKEDITDCIVERLIRGQISGKDMEKFDVEKWRELMTSKVWRSERGNTGYGQLSISTLEWIVLNDSNVTENDLGCFLDRISGFPEDLTAVKNFIRAIKSEVSEIVVSTTERLSSPLQIYFWRRISDYMFQVSDLGFVSTVSEVI